MRNSWTLAAILLITPFVGCSQEQTPDEAMKVISTSLANNEPQVAWEGLPPSYQKDVDGLVHEFAGKMDPEIWNSGFGIAKKIVKIMDEKREFILNNEMLSKTNMNLQENKNEWDGLVKALSTLVNSELSDLEELKTVEVKSFLADTGSEFMKQMDALVAITGQDKFKNEMADYKEAKFKLISTEGDTGVIEVSVPDEEPETVEMVKVEGKWIPKEMADEWATKMQEAKEALDEIPVDQMQENKVQLLAQMKMIDAQLNLLLDAKTAEEFNATFGPMAMLLSMSFGGGGPIGPSAGPGPGPGPGGFEITPEGGEFTPGGEDDVPDGLLNDEPLPGEGAFSATPEGAAAEVEVTVPANEE